MEPHRGILILILGILSLVLCWFFTGIPAWIMGKSDLAKIEAGQMNPEGKGLTMAGMICGIICCVMTLISFGIIILFMILGGGIAALSSWSVFQIFWMIFEVNQNLLNGVGGQSLRDIKRDEELAESVGLEQPEDS